MAFVRKIRALTIILEDTGNLLDPHAPNHMQQAHQRAVAAAQGQQQFGQRNMQAPFPVYRAQGNLERPDPHQPVPRIEPRDHPGMVNRPPIPPGNREAGLQDEHMRPPYPFGVDPRNRRHYQRDDEDFVGDARLLALLNPPAPGPAPELGRPLGQTARQAALRDEQAPPPPIPGPQVGLYGQPGRQAAMSVEQRRLEQLQGAPGRYEVGLFWVQLAQARQRALLEVQRQAVEAQRAIQEARQQAAGVQYGQPRYQEAYLQNIWPQIPHLGAPGAGNIAAQVRAEVMQPNPLQQMPQDQGRMAGLQDGVQAVQINHGGVNVATGVPPETGWRQDRPQIPRQRITERLEPLFDPEDSDEDEELDGWPGQQMEIPPVRGAWWN